MAAQADRLLRGRAVTRRPLARSPMPWHARKAQPTRCAQNILHQSKLEATRCDELHLLQRGGMIHDLQAHPQPRYRLDVNGVHVCVYHPDFEYLDRDGEKRVEDTKGILTKDHEMKLRLMKALHGIDVELVRKAERRR